MDEESEARWQLDAFIVDALQALEQFLSEGVAYDAAEIHRHIRARIAGQWP